MTKYIKTGDTIFEQFDGSDAMCKKYKMSYVTQGITKDGSYRVTDDNIELVNSNFKINTEYGETCICIGDWIETDSEGKHWGVYDTALRDTYEDLPTISKNVEKYLKYCKSWGTLADAFVYAEENVASGDVGGEVLDYLAYHSEDFALAWIKGYITEED